MLHRHAAPFGRRDDRMLIVAGLMALGAGLSFAGADLHAQSLAALAVREAGRRAAITTPAHVYTNVPQTEQKQDDAPALPSLESAPREPHQSPQSASIKAVPQFRSASPLRHLHLPWR